MSERLKNLINIICRTFDDENEKEFIKKHREAAALSEKEKKPAESELLKGLMCEHEKNREKAEEYYQKALRIDPGHVITLNCYCILLYKLERYVESEFNFKEALRIDPDYADTHINYGNLLNKLERYDESEIQYKEVILINPEDSHAHYNYGNLLDKLERYNESEIQYKEAIRIDPEHASTHYKYGFLLNKLERYEESETQYKEALQIDPDHAGTHINYGILLYKLERYEESEFHFKEAIRIDPDHAGTHTNYGILLDKLERYEESEFHFKEAFRIDPEQASTHYNYGVLLYKLERYEESEFHFKEAFRIDPEYANAHYNYGVLLQNKKHYARAKKRFLKALELSKAKEDYKLATFAEWWIDNINKKITEKKKAEREKKKLRKQPEQDVVEAVFEELKDKKKEIFSSIEKKEKEIAEFKSAKKTLTHKNNFFIVLRRWNSYTPAVQDDKGGGYFLSWNGKGIVIDPGFNFIENFIKEGFKIADIDAVVITHSHIDHCIDFEKIITLLHERNEGKNKNEMHLVDVFMNIGALNKYLGMISPNNENIRKIYSLDIGDAKVPDGYGFTLSVTKAKHKEMAGEHYCTGLIFKLGNGKDAFKLGITSDTGYTDEIGKQYRGCDMLVAHLGTILETEFDTNKDIEDRLYENHLGLIGVTKIINDAKPKLAVISEFGQELGRNRVKIVEAIKNALKVKCFTGDIGLKVKIPDIKIRCDWCENGSAEGTYKDIDKIKERCPQKKVEVEYYYSN